MAFSFKNLFKPKNEVTISNDVLLQALINGETITREQAMSLPAVSSAVDYISSTIASIPIKLYKEVNGRVEEVKDDVRVSMLNYDTRDTLDGFQFKKALINDYLMGKGGYAYIKKTRNDYKGLYYVKDIDISINKNINPIFKSYRILVNAKEYYPWDFIKLLRNTQDGATGTGVTEEVGKALDTAYQTLLYQLGLVKSGGNKKGFLKSKNHLTEEAMTKLKQGWQELYANNTTSTIVLNDGLEFQESSNSSVEMQLNESKKTLQDEINNIFHISDDFNTTFKKAIYPIIRAFTTALNRDFLLESEKANYYWSFDIKEITKASIKERYEAYKLAIETGFMTLNEVRYEEDMNSIDGLDVIPLSLGDVLFDTKTKEYFTPNTGQIKTNGGQVEGGDENE